MGTFDPTWGCIRVSDADAKWLHKNITDEQIQEETAKIIILEVDYETGIAPFKGKALSN